MKKVSILLIILLLIPVCSWARSGQCPSCGASSPDLYCPRCGAQTAQQVETEPARETGEYRKQEEIAFETADSLAGRLATKDRSGVPLYTPASPQPMNAYLIADRKCQVGIDSQGMCLVSESGNIRSFASTLREWAREIADESMGAIRFVSDPDCADILISARQTFEFYATYSGGGFSSKGYSSVVLLQAFRLTDPGRTVKMTLRQDPADTETLRRNADKFWKQPPELESTKELADFVTGILRWYGYEPEKKEQVLAVQKQLIGRGYLSGTAGGKWDDDTEHAVRLLQQDCHLTPTGRVDRATLIALYYDMQALYYALDRYPALQNAAVSASDAVCPQCRWAYDAKLGYSFCPHCGTALSASVQTTLPGRGMKVGDTVRFGVYEQGNGPEAIEWLVLDVQKINGSRCALLLSRYALDAREYYREYDQSITWETSDLRAWLNNQFYYTAFGEKEQAVIRGVTVDNSDATRNTDWVIKGGKNTNDRVFLLSWADVFKTYFGTDKERVCLPTPYARLRGEGTGEVTSGVYWWLRSPGNGKGSATAVSPEGALDYWTVMTSLDSVNHCAVYVRPALWIDLDSLPE